MSTIDILVPEQAEGTRFSLRAWLKPIGAAIAREEPIAEIETDKVTMEVTAPADGVLQSVLVDKGAELQPGMKIGVIAGEAAAPRSEILEPAAVAAPAASAASRAAQVPSTGEHNTRLSPLVKRLLAQNNVRAEDIAGTGRNGRVTPADVLAYASEGRGKSKSASVPQKSVYVPGPGRSQRIAHTNMRRAIAEHMARSVSVAPHVTAVFEADFSAVFADRRRRKAESRTGEAPTVMAYIVAACVEALKAQPKANSRWHDDAIEIFDDLNIGFGVALGDEGLIVPVIHRAQDLSLPGIAQRLDELTAKARGGKLQAADLQGGTFTISNHGTSGSLLATPIIINQPQSAILGVGKVEKRVVVREIDGRDSIIIAPMAYVTLTIDHRVLDGHQTNAFLTRWVEVIENWR